MPGAFEGETVTRRRFMTGTVHGAGALMAAGFTLPALAFAIGPIFQNQTLGWQPVGLPDEYPDDNYIPAVMTTAPGIGDAGKSTVYIRTRNPKIDTTPANQYNRWVAITSRCAHLGCPVRWVPAAERFICPCHGGVYDLQGVRVAGPPPRPLDRFYTRLHNGMVEVGPRYSVNSLLRIFSPRDPGEPLDGIGQYLYPSRPSVRAF
ncbi:MAG: ubiquinol-cytochrome c reductase iron-sulfur subunit [Solirubrobacteraceae bacterium]